MQKKDYYKHNLPHFQQPGQAYFVSWSLKDAVPKHALKYFTNQLEILRSQIKMGLAVSKPPDPKINREMEFATPSQKKQINFKKNISLLETNK